MSNLTNPVNLDVIDEIFIRNSYETIWDIIILDISGSVLPPHVEETIQQLEAVGMEAFEYKAKASNKIATIKVKQLKKLIEEDNEVFAKLVALIDGDNPTNLYDYVWELVVDLD